MVSNTLQEVTEKLFLTDEGIYKAIWLAFCSQTFCILMRIDQFNNFTTDTGDI